MAEEMFVGRRDELARFAALLDDLGADKRGGLDRWWPRRRSADNQAEVARSRVVLVHGLGGSGKSRLLKHFREMTDGSLPNSPIERNQIQTAWLDWEDEQRDQPSNYAGVDGPSLVTVLDAIQKMVTNSFRQDASAPHVFADYRRGAARMPEYAARFADILSQSKQTRSPFTATDATVLLRAAASAGLVGIGHPSGIAGLTPDQLALSVQAAGRLSEAATQAIAGKKVGEISPHEYDLISDPQRELTRRVTEAIRVLALRKPLVIFLDTGEVLGGGAWVWLRRVMAGTGQRVVWVVGARFETEAEAGVDSIIARFVRDIGDEHLLLMSPTRFDDTMICDYLRSRTNNRNYTTVEIDTIARFTRGLPLAVSFTAQLIAEGQSVEDVCHELDDGFPSSVVARLARRYLIHAESQTYSTDDPRRNDVIKILGLALAFADLRNDPELLAVLWATGDPLAEFQDLARRHDFVLPVSRRLHDDVRETLRIDLLDPYRRDRAREINRRALDLFVSRLDLMREKWPSLDDQLDHSSFRTALLSVLWHMFWMENQAGQDLFIQILPVVAVADPRIGDAATAIVDQFVDTFDNDQRRDLDLFTEVKSTPMRMREGRWTVQATVTPARRARRELSSEALRKLRLEESRTWVGNATDREAAISILKAKAQTSDGDDKGAVANLRKAIDNTSSRRLRWFIGSIAEDIADRHVWSRTNGSPKQTTIGLEAAEIATMMVPSNVHAWRDYAVALATMDRQDEALTAYDQAISLEADDATLHYNRAITLCDLGRTEDALSAYDMSIALDPDDPDAYSKKGIVLCELDRFKEALTAFERAITLQPDDAANHLDRGKALDSLGRFEEALAAFDRAVTLNPDDPAAHFDRGSVLYELDRKDEALAALDQAIILNPDDPAAHLNRGKALDSLGRFEEALAAFDRAVTLNPDDPAAHFDRGIVLYELDRKDDALAALDQAITLQPDDAAAHLNRGITLNNLGRLEEAIGAHDRAATLNPDDPTVHFNRGITLYDLGRFEEALAAYDENITLSPDDPAAHFNRGYILHTLGRIDDALCAYDQALTLDPDDGTIHSRRGIILAEKGDLAGALIEFNVAEHITPDEAGESEAWAGAILWHQRETTRARDRFARVVGRVARCTPFHTAGLEAAALCGIGDIARAERHLLDALPLRAPGDRYQVRGLYHLLSVPELPGIDRLRNILEGDA